MTAPRLVRTDDVLAQDLDGQLLLLRPGAEDVLHLDVIASQVWALLDRPRTLAELAQLLAEAYAVPVAQVADDLQPALAVLQSHGFVRDLP